MESADSMCLLVPHTWTQTFPAEAAAAAQARSQMGPTPGRCLGWKLRQAPLSGRQGLWSQPWLTEALGWWSPTFWASFLADSCCVRLARQLALVPGIIAGVLMRLWAPQGSPPAPHRQAMGGGADTSPQLPKVPGQEGDLLARVMLS